jgi:dienelactone hydrolase
MWRVLAILALFATAACVSAGQSGPVHSPWLDRSRLPDGSTVVEVTTVEPAQSLRSPAAPDRIVPKPPQAVGGALVLPPGPGPFPAVVVLHSTGGIDGRATPYVEALRNAGIASLQIDMWGPRGVSPGVDLPRSRPYSTFDTSADAVGALAFLAAHPQIDADRIGVMGQSWGAIMGFNLSSPAVRMAFPQVAVWFRGVASLYPVCWPFIPGGSSERLISGDWPLVPVLVLAAGTEDYDTRPNGQDCRDAFGPSPRRAGGAPVTLHVYDNVFHSWDRPRQGSVTFFDPAAAGGRGGLVRATRHDGATVDAARRVRDFFVTVLAPSPRPAMR